MPRGPKGEEPSTLDAAFGRALREARHARETPISQEQLALDTGYHRTYISLLERGINSPSLRTIDRLARALNVKPSTLVANAEAYAEKTRG